MLLSQCEEVKKKLSDTPKSEINITSFIDGNQYSSQVNKTIVD